MAKTCAFCGAAGPLTKEHLLPAWLGRIGLPDDLMTHTTGRLNRSPENRGASPPFVRTVSDVCGACNGGWMCALDAAAKIAFADPVRGLPTTMDAALRGAVAAWFQKICLVNMLATPDASTVQETELGSEMRALRETGSLSMPLPQTTLWIGRHNGERFWSVCLTPMVAGVAGLPLAETPNAYVMTVVIGELLLHGIRFTTPLLAFDVAPSHGLVQLWPGTGPVTWPCGTPANDATVTALQVGRSLRPTDARFTLGGWKPAVDLPDQEIDGEWIQIQTPCGKHFARYPLPIALAARDGIACAFEVACACPRRYLVLTDKGGARFRVPGDGAETDERVRSEYDRLAGVERVLEGPLGIFEFKELAERHP